MLERDCTVRWSGKYERRLDNVLAVEDDICRKIAGALQLRLTSAPAVHASARPRAHIEYLKGRYFWNRRTADALERSLEHYARATALDPRYAPAYCGMADTLFVQSLNDQAVSAEALPRATAYAERAFDIDPELPEALVSSAALASVYECDWGRGEALFRRAIALNPSGGVARYLFPVVNLAPRGLWDEAHVEMDRAIELDPVSPVLYRDLGIIYYLQRQYREAEEALNQARRLDSSFHAGLFWLACVLAQQQRFDEAVAALEARLALPSPSTTRAMSVLIHTLAAMGRQREAREHLAALEQRAATVPPLNLAIAYLGCGDPSRTLAYLEKASAERAAPLYQIGVDPIYDPLRTHPRFQAILRKMRLDNGRG